MSRRDAVHFVRSYWPLRGIPYVRALIHNLLKAAKAAKGSR
jgi:hypothetical protein